MRSSSMGFLFTGTPVSTMQFAGVGRGFVVAAMQFDLVLPYTLQISFFVCSDLHCNVVKSRLGGATMQFVCVASVFVVVLPGGARVLIVLCMVVCWWFVLQRRAVRQAVSCASQGHGVRFTGRRLCVRFAICFDIFVFIWVICKTAGAFL